MAKGDHLYVSYGIFTHHGIDMGDGTVVALSKEKENENKTVSQVSFAEFCNGRRVMVREYLGCDPASKVIQRAKSRIGQRGYHLLTNNCEHFATWCKTGDSKSAQVEMVKRQVVAAGTKGMLKATTKVLAKSGSKILAKTPGRVVTPWLLVADGVQLATEAVASNVGADPDDAKGLGRAAGLTCSVGIGVACGGPIGACVGFGLWLFGEVTASILIN